METTIMPEDRIKLDQAPWESGKEVQVLEKAPWDIDEAKKVEDKPKTKHELLQETKAMAQSLSPEQKKRIQELYQKGASKDTQVKAPSVGQTIKEATPIVTGGMKKGLPFVGPWMDEWDLLSEEEKLAMERMPEAAQAVELATALGVPIPGINKFKALGKALVNMTEAGIAGAGIGEEGNRTQSAVVGTLFSALPMGVASYLGRGTKSAREMDIETYETIGRLIGPDELNRLTKHLTDPKSISEAQGMIKRALINTDETLGSILGTKQKFSKDYIDKAIELKNKSFEEYRELGKQLDMLFENPDLTKPFNRAVDDSLRPLERRGAEMSDEVADLLEELELKQNKVQADIDALRELEELTGKQEARLDILEFQKNKLGKQMDEIDLYGDNYRLAKGIKTQLNKVKQNIDNTPSFTALPAIKEQIRDIAQGGKALEGVDTKEAGRIIKSVYLDFQSNLDEMVAAADSTGNILKQYKDSRKKLTYIPDIADKLEKAYNQHLKSPKSEVSISNLLRTTADIWASVKTRLPRSQTAEEVSNLRDPFLRKVEAVRGLDKKIKKAQREAPIRKALGTGLERGTRYQVRELQDKEK